MAIDPCGTPVNIVLSDELHQFNVTYCFRLSK